MTIPSVSLLPLQKQGEEQVKEHAQQHAHQQDERRSRGGGKNYESNMYTLDKKMHKNLANVDVILHGLKDKLSRHKELKNVRERGFLTRGGSLSRVITAR